MSGQDTKGTEENIFGGGKCRKGGREIPPGGRTFGSEVVRDVREKRKL